MFNPYERSIPISLLLHLIELSDEGGIKMSKKLISNFLKKIPSKRGRSLKFQAKRAAVKDSLGNGYQRFTFEPVSIAPREFVVFTLTAPTGSFVINGGWTISAFLPAYATDSFPFQRNQWVIIIFNPTNFTRQVTTYLITKPSR
jgi:hypothetical protein